MKFWEEGKDYKSEMDAYAAAGDKKNAAIAEFRRNQKIDDLGLSEAKTHDYESYLPFDADLDYMEKMQDAQSRGDYTAYATYQRGRNKKLDALGLKNEKTNYYTAYQPFEYEEFEYNPATDASYNNYVKMYKRNMKRAVEDTLGKYAGMTGGLPSTAAMGAATQAGAYEMQKATDIIPELEALARSKYDKDRNFEYNKYIDTRNQQYQMQRDFQNDAWKQKEWELQDLQNHEKRGKDYFGMTGDSGGLPGEWYTPEAKQLHTSIYNESQNKQSFSEALNLVSGGIALETVKKLYPELTQEEIEAIREIAVGEVRDTGSSGSSGAKTKSSSSYGAGNDTESTISGKEKQEAADGNNETEKSGSDIFTEIGKDAGKEFSESAEDYSLDEIDSQNLIDLGLGVVAQILPEYIYKAYEEGLLVTADSSGDKLKLKWASDEAEETFRQWVHAYQAGAQAGIFLRWGEN